MLPEDTEPAIISDNVEGMIMLIDYLSKNYADKKDIKYKGFALVLEGDHEEIAEAIVEHYRYVLLCMIIIIPVSKSIDSVKTGKRGR